MTKTTSQARAIAIFVAASFVVTGGEISSYHFQHLCDAAAKPNAILAQPKDLGPALGLRSTNYGISEIGIERTVCFGSCPAYSFIVSSNGNFRYEGEKHVKRAGKATGTVSVCEFEQLARFIRDSG